MKRITAFVSLVVLLFCIGSAFVGAQTNTFCSSSAPCTVTALWNHTGGLQINGINIPAVPAYKVENVNVSPVTVVNNATEQNLMTFTIPANELAVNQVVRAHFTGTDLNSSGGNVSYTFKTYLDANLLSATQGLVLGTGNNAGWEAWTHLIVQTAGAGGAVEASSIIAVSSTPVSAPGADAAYNSNQSATLAFDTTATHVIKITITMNTASANASSVERKLFIERLG